MTHPMKPLHEIARECAEKIHKGNTQWLEDRATLNVPTLTDMILTALTAAQQSGEQDGEWAKRAAELVDWLNKDYFWAGGLFNPEMANHQVVSTKLMEIRDFLDRISHAPRSDGVDGERLDWLERQKAGCNYGPRDNPTMFHCWVEVSGRHENPADHYYGESLRAAIDAARSQEGTP